MPTDPDPDDDPLPEPHDGMTPKARVGSAPEIKWQEDDRLLVLDGEEFDAQGDPPRADVRVGVLRRLRANQLPEGLEVQAVRKVAGSSREFFPEGGCPIFSRDGSRGILLVEEAVVVDEEDEPDPEARAARLRAEVREVLEKLADLKRDGRINWFEAGSVYPEDGLAYWSCTLTVGDLGRAVYEIMTDTPELALLPGHWSSPHPGLTLTFDTRLHRFDATAFDALIAEVLGPETDVTIEERSNIDAEGPAFIRINGSRPEDLLAVAEGFYNRVWRSGEAVVEDRALRRTMTALETLFGPVLERMRKDISEVKANTGADGAVAAGLQSLADAVVSDAAAKSLMILEVKEAVHDLDDRLAGLPAEVAALAATAEFQAQVLAEAKHRLVGIERKVADHQFLLEDVLAPVVETQLRRRFEPVDIKVIKAVATFLLGAVGGDLLGDQVDLQLKLK